MKDKILKWIRYRHFIIDRNEFLEESYTEFLSYLENISNEFIEDEKLNLEESWEIIMELITELSNEQLFLLNEKIETLK